MLNLGNIDMNVDYSDLGFTESHLLHEVKRRGTADFIKVYGDNIEEFRRDWSKINFCFLLALLEYLDSNFQYDSNIKLDKYILDPRDFLLVELDNDLTEAENSYNNCLPSFLKRGFIYSELGEAV